MTTYSLDYIDDLYVQYIKDPSSVSPGWRRYFEEFSLASQHTGVAATAVAAVEPAADGYSAAARDEALWLARMQDRIDQLVREYRVRGHLMAKLDPLGIDRQKLPELDPQMYGLSEEDLSRPFSCASLDYVNARTLGGIVEKLRNTYCRNIGAQFTHIDNRNIRDWLQRRMESCENRIELSREVQTRIYTRLADASVFEEFVRRKFVGHKTFSLEGAESLIPLLDLALEKAGQHGIEGVVLGMAHRGRLNVLANVMGKRAQNIFWGFDDPRPDLHRGAGDVKYHLGYSSDWTTSSGAKVHLSLCFNPSHLEFVNPVALGRCRSKQDLSGDFDRERQLTLLIHGDASFAGEGIIQETFNISQLSAYNTGGTLHVIINNQVGFTTEPSQSRSTTYCTDVAKMLQIPIFHVNGEDPEAVAQVVNLAMDFRREFRRDVVIDMYAYRRWGHNESDEPRFTQPTMYKAIDQRKSVRESYLERLLQMGEITRAEADDISKVRQDKLEAEFAAAQRKEDYYSDLQTLGGLWQGYFGGPEPDVDETVTSLAAEVVNDVLAKLCEVPAGFHLNSKLAKIFEQRLLMATSDKPLDWAAGELLALGTLSMDGHPIRITGQDSERGTFSHRHANLHDMENNATHMPLQHLAASQARVEIVNSPLSEAAILGFEYGYSLDCPHGLVAWEAQFGDFWNVAQVIVDQFISSAEDKWGRLSRLIMLLPHGFEGAGPEHCSARLERLLQLCAEDNMIVAQPTTPAQYFHLLRRQVKRKWSKPLVVMTPKWLLRHPMVLSAKEEFTSGRFMKILKDERPSPTDTNHILLCTGKVYYELVERRQNTKADHVAILRVEQLYPLSNAEVMGALEPYRAGTEVVWVQDEPANMGAWTHMKMRFGDAIQKKFPFSVVSRTESASPATGSPNTHKLEQQELLDAAFANL